VADCTLWSFFPSPDCILSSNYWVAIFIPRVFHGRGWSLGEMVAYSVSDGNARTWYVRVNKIEGCNLIEFETT
jgi:hypothetical protein